MLNTRIILLIMGLLLVVEGVFMLISAGVAAYYGEYDLPAFLWTSIISIILGLVLRYFNRNAVKDIGKREGYLIVTTTWVLFSFVGLLPFYLSGAIPSFTDAFFETMSGFTTTGSSILNDIESLPHGVLFWRSMIQWLGGMGIIVLSIAILPLLGVSGMQLFAAEVPGPVPDKLHPRIADTAKRLWFIYLGYTLAETLLLWLGGMTFFDAICHSFTTMATGGYSTKQASIAFYTSPFIQYVIIAFMLIAGINFSLSYLAIHGKIKSVIKDEEFKYYIGIIFVISLVVAIVIYMSENNISIEKSWRDALFQVVSLITTTGYATADYLLWAKPLIIIMFLLMFVGGSAGSTGGGIKVVRIVLLIKNAHYELKRLIHPNAVIPVRFNNKAVSSNIIFNVLAFIVIYFIIVGISTFIMSIMNYDLDTSIGAVATCIGNIGPGLGKVGPASNFADIPDFGKWFLSFLMLIGRLEIFTVLLLFAPAFWKN